MKKLFVLAVAVSLLAGAGAAVASVFAPGGFLSDGSIQLSPTLTLHAVCDVYTSRIVYVAAQTRGGVSIALSERLCTIPDDTP